MASTLLATCFLTSAAVVISRGGVALPEKVRRAQVALTCADDLPAALL